jgi:nucleoid-associated protein
MPSASGEGFVFDSALSGSNEDDAHARLFDSLRAALHGNARRQHGVFKPEAPDSVLKAGIGEYHNKTLDAKNMGLRLAEQLRQGLISSDLQHPWHLWFIVEQSGEEEFIYLFLLKQEESYHLSAQHTVTLGGAIRIDRLHYAAKISLTEWRNHSETYLTYLAPKNQNPTTIAWAALIGFAETINQSAKTEVLLTTIDRYAEELPAEEKHPYRARVAEYCLDQDRIGEPVEIKALSRHVDENAPAALLDFLTKHIEEETTALYPDRKQLKRYTRLFGRDNDLSIGFSTQMLGNHIIYDERTETLTIRSIPKSLKSQLSRYIKKAE